MCHGRIAPKSTSALAVASAGHGMFLPLVILSTLLGDGLASGGFRPASVWEKTCTIVSPKAGIGDSPSSSQLQGEQRGLVGFCAVGQQGACPGGVAVRGPVSQLEGGVCGNLLGTTTLPALSPQLESPGRMEL